MTLPLLLSRRTLPTVLLDPVACPVRPLVGVRTVLVVEPERGVRETILVERGVGGDDERRTLGEVRLGSLVDDDDERRVLEEVGAVRVTVRVLLATRRLELDGCRSLRLDERTLPTFPLRRTLPALTVASSSFF